MGLRDTLKDLVNGIKEEHGNDMNKKKVDEEVAKIKAAENRKWREELEVSVGEAGEGRKSALKEKVRPDNVKTNNSPKGTKKGQPKGQPKRMKADRERDD